MPNITSEQLKAIIKEEIVEKRQTQIMINEELDVIAEQETIKVLIEAESGLAGKIGHTALDIIGAVTPLEGTGIAQAADLLNALWYAKEGRYFLTAVSLISLLPLVGDVLGKGTKIGIWLAKTFPKGYKAAVKYGDEVVIAVKNLQKQAKRHAGALKKMAKGVENGDPSVFPSPMNNMTPDQFKMLLDKVGISESDRQNIGKELIEAIDIFTGSDDPIATLAGIDSSDDSEESDELSMASIAELTIKLV
tara:strand:- start:6854 stop:7600 length:747 start_codon:yes stop_codon:yes gene_type:complete